MTCFQIQCAGKLSALHSWQCPFVYDEITSGSPLFWAPWICHCTRSLLKLVMWSYIWCISCRFFTGGAGWVACSARGTHVLPAFLWQATRWNAFLSMSHSKPLNRGMRHTLSQPAGLSTSPAVTATVPLLVIEPADLFEVGFFFFQVLTRPLLLVRLPRICILCVLCVCVPLEKLISEMRSSIKEKYAATRRYLGGISCLTLMVQSALRCRLTDLTLC